MGFIYVDRILEMDPGKTVRSVKTITENEEIFEVHYPGFPVLPGSFLIEMMAQTAGRCLDAEKKPRGLAMLAKIKTASFRQYVGPNTEAIIFGTIRSNRDAFATADSHVEVNGQRVCSAELFFTFVPMKNLSPDFKDKVLDSFFSK